MTGIRFAPRAWSRRRRTAGLIFAALSRISWTPASDVGDSIRYYLNSLTSVSDAWLSESLLKSHLAGIALYAGVPEGTDLDEAAPWKDILGRERGRRWLRRFAFPMMRPPWSAAVSGTACCSLSNWNRSPKAPRPLTGRSMWRRSTARFAGCWTTTTLSASSRMSTAGVTSLWLGNRLLVSRPCGPAQQRRPDHVPHEQLGVGHEAGVCGHAYRVLP